VRIDDRWQAATVKPCGPDGAIHHLRCELLERLAGKRPVRVIVIDTFRSCGHARAFNSRVDANGQARCVICRQGRRLTR
jgi:hypothetical protein